MEPIRSSSPPARHWRITIPVSLGILLLLASLVVAAIELETQSRKSSEPTIAASTPADDQRWSSLGYGDIEGGVTPLYPLQPGRVKSIDVRENEFVKAGQPLFQVEVPGLADTVREAEAALKAAQEQQAVAEEKVVEVDKQIAAQQQAIEAAKLKVQQADIAVKRQRRLNRPELNPPEELENAEITKKLAEQAVKGEQKKLDAAKAGRRVAEGLVRVTRASVEAKQAQLTKARNALNECVVRAPVDGVPVRILISKGEVLGTNPRQPAIQFAAERPLLVRAEVEQEFVDRVHEGQSVVIKDNVTEKELAHGRVASLARWYAPRRTASTEVLAINSDVRTLECIIHIESKQSVIRIGQRVRVQFLD